MTEKLAESLKWALYVKVTFTGGFPVDMLRYDNCMPARECDSYQIASSLDPSQPAVKRVVYLKRYQIVEVGIWTERRWKSWGIHVDLEPVDKWTRIPKAAAETAEGEKKKRSEQS